MQKKNWIAMSVTGLVAGAVNGLFGAGGGMLLVPLLAAWCQLDQEAVFPTSVSIILPICLISLLFSSMEGGLPWGQAVPWLIGSGTGGLLAGFWGRKIPVVWLHRGLGILILWGGVRYLW